MFGKVLSLLQLSSCRGMMHLWKSLDYASLTQFLILGSYDLGSLNDVLFPIFFTNKAVTGMGQKCHGSNQAK